MYRHTYNHLANYAFIFLFISILFKNNVTIPGVGRTSLVFYASIGIMLFFVALKNRVTLLPREVMSIIGLIVLSSLISSLYLQNAKPFITFGMFAALLLLLWNVSTGINKQSFFVEKSIVWAGILLVLLSFYATPLTMYRYEGMLDMPNSMGRVSAVLLGNAILFFLFHKSHSWEKYFLSFVILALLMFLLFSNSRAPILAFSVSIFGVLLMYGIKRKKLFKYVIWTLFVIIASYLVVANFMPNLIEIFAFKFNRGDGTSGRLELWRSGLVYYDFFGSNQYIGLSHKIDVHNNYLSQALKFGTVTSILFHFVPVLILLKSITRFIVREHFEYSTAAVYFMSSFTVIYYVFETTAITLSYLLMIYFYSKMHRE